MTNIIVEASVHRDEYIEKNLSQQTHNTQDEKDGYMKSNP